MKGFISNPDVRPTTIKAKSMPNLISYIFNLKWKIDYIENSVLPTRDYLRVIFFYSEGLRWKQSHLIYKSQSNDKGKWSLNKELDYNLDFDVQYIGWWCGPRQCQGRQGQRSLCQGQGHCVKVKVVANVRGKTNVSCAHFKFVFKRGFMIQTQYEVNTN